MQQLIYWRAVPVEGLNCEPSAANTPSGWEDECLGLGISVGPSGHPLQFTAGAPQNPIVLYSNLANIEIAGSLFFLQTLIQDIQDSFFPAENSLRPVLNNELSLSSCACNYWLACGFFFSGSGQFKGLLFIIVFFFTLNLLCLAENGMCPMSSTHLALKEFSVIERNDYKKWMSHFCRYFGCIPKCSTKIAESSKTGDIEYIINL